MLIYLFCCVCVCRCMCTSRMLACVYRRVRECPMWTLGIKLRSLGLEPSTLTDWVISSASKIIFIIRSSNILWCLVTSNGFMS